MLILLLRIYLLPCLHFTAEIEYKQTCTMNLSLFLILFFSYARFFIFSDVQMAYELKKDFEMHRYTC